MFCNSCGKPISKELLKKIKGEKVDIMEREKCCRMEIMCYLPNINIK